MTIDEVRVILLCGSSTTDWAFASNDDVAFVRAVGAPSVGGTVQGTSEKVSTGVET